MTLNINYAWYRIDAMIDPVMTLISGRPESKLISCKIMYVHIVYEIM